MALRRKGDVEDDGVVTPVAGYEDRRVGGAGEFGVAARAASPARLVDEEEAGLAGGGEGGETGHDAAGPPGAVEVGAGEGIVERVHDDEGGARLAAEAVEFDGMAALVEGREIVHDGEISGDGAGVDRQEGIVGDEAGGAAADGEAGEGAPGVHGAGEGEREIGRARLGGGGEEDEADAGEEARDEPVVGIGAEGGVRGDHTLTFAGEVSDKVGRRFSLGLSPEGRRVLYPPPRRLAGLRGPGRR